MGTESLARKVGVVELITKSLLVELPGRSLRNLVHETDAIGKPPQEEVVLN